MESKDIINGSKLIAEYLGWVYIPFSADLKHKAGWWSKVPKTEEDVFFSKVNGNDGFVCRNHSDLRFWNSLDALVPVIQKIEKEKTTSDERFKVIKKDSNEVIDGFLNYSIQLYNNGASCEAELLGGHSVEICSSFDLPNWSNNVFTVVLSFLRKNLENKK